MSLFTDLRELKKILEIDPDDTVEDWKFLYLTTVATEWIEEILNRPGFSQASRTEYYNGTSTQKLLLNSRPVLSNPVPQVWVDDGGYYGSISGAFTAAGSQLNYGSDFCLKIDQPDGTTSRSGILVRINDYWDRPQVRQIGLLSPFVGEAFGNIKVTYTGGYTIDMLPAQFRFGCNLLVSKLRHLMPLGLELNSENWESRSISWSGDRKNYLLGLVKPFIYSYRNWKW